jgi:2-polyprenyl-6-methoxyphenol hydroxylase-like FAD-dependent oxidoreductase
MTLIQSCCVLNLIQDTTVCGPFSVEAGPTFFRQSTYAVKPIGRQTETHPVAIVGAGPTGLALALGLARHGVRSVLFERDESTSDYSKAPGIHVRTREVFRQWGVEDRFIEAGELLQTVTLHSTVPGRHPLLSLDLSGIEDEADRPGLLILEQARTEQLLLDAVRQSGLCEVRFGAEVVGLAQDEAGATLTVRQRRGEDTVRARFVVGCDGASSFVRTALGLPFDGHTYSLRPMLADVRITDDRDDLAWPRVWDAGADFSFTARLGNGLWRIVSLQRRQPKSGDEVSDSEVKDLVEKLLGPGPAQRVWASRFRIHVRASPRFRVGSVVLAGDAAHVHSPAGGFGMNGGIQDAHNLAWKLAHALRGGEADRLLDSYEQERQSVIVERVSRFTDFVTRGFLDAPRFVRSAAFVLARTLTASRRLRRRLVRRMSMIDLDYPASPILDRRDLAAGKRLPDPVLRAPDGTEVRLYDLLPVGPVLLDVAENRAFSDDLPLHDVIRIGRGEYLDSGGHLRRLLGGRDGWMLGRPDAHIAWARHSAAGMRNAVNDALALAGR